MRKKIVEYFLLITIVLMPASALAKETNPGVNKNTNRVTTGEEERISNLKTRAKKEIDKRLGALTKLDTKIDSLKKLSASQKTSLKAEVDRNISDLTALLAKINADTDLAALKADVKSIVDSYRIYALFIPKVHILAAADAATETSALLTALADKLSARIDQAGADDKDIAALKTALLDMRSKIGAADSKIAAVETNTIPLEPQGYPANKTTLSEAKDALRSAHKELMSAQKDGKTIITALKALEKSNSNVNANTNKR